jgi:hypothetical protein
MLGVVFSRDHLVSMREAIHVEEDQPTRAGPCTLCIYVEYVVGIDGARISNA